MSTSDDDAATTMYELPAGDAGDTGGTGADDVLRTLAALAMLGAAVIHFAFAPDHLAEQTSHGMFFLVAGWAQLLGAAALAFRWRPQRAWLLGSAAFNVGVAGLWLLSRTVGLPGDEPEPVAFPDTLATGLEVLAAGAALRARLRLGDPCGRGADHRLAAGPGLHRRARGRARGRWSPRRSSRRSAADTPTPRATRTGTATAMRPPRAKPPPAGTATTTLPPARTTPSPSSASPRSPGTCPRPRSTGSARSTTTTSPSRSATGRGSSPA